VFIQPVVKVLFWTYERGSWQYDVICAVILAFIFLTPSTIFDGSAFLRYQSSVQEERRASIHQADVSHSTLSTVGFEYLTDE